MATPLTRYLDARVENAKTMGDAYEHVRRDHDAFVGGAQYALDTLLALTDIGVPISSDHLHLVAINVLERAKKGEP